MSKPVLVSEVYSDFSLKGEKKRKEAESVEREVVDFHKVQTSLVEEKPDGV